MLLLALSFRALLSSGAGGTDTAGLVRWGDLVIRVPENSMVTVSRESLPKEEYPPDGGLVVYLEKSPSRLIVSAETGYVLYDAIKEEDRAAFDEITATITVGAPRQGSLGWPYATDAPPEPRGTYGGLTYAEPDLSSGIQLHKMSGYGLEYLRVSNGRSTLFINARTGAVLEQDTVILADDQAAFERFVATVDLRR